MACLLWEDNFYEDGESAADRIAMYMKNVTPAQATKVLEEAKFDNKLRHMPLYLMVQMAKRNCLTADQVAKIVTRVDDMSELIALYHNDKGNKHMLPHPIQKGLAKAFPKFDEYQFAKYRGNKKAIKLKDVIRLAHPKPENEAQSKLWKKILEDTLATPDTWEVALSASKDKKAEWTRLLTEKTDKGFSKLGATALLMNLRNMDNANVDTSLVKKAIMNMSTKNILPFQFVTAARYAPNYTDVLEKKFLESMQNVEKLKGSTIILMDVSGSMAATLSNKGTTTRVDVAAGLGAIAREVAEDPIIYTFNEDIELIPSHYRGFALVDKVREGFGGTAVIRCANKAINNFKKSHDGKNPDRIIVITDEQTNSDLSGYDFYSSNKVVKLNNLPKSSHGYMVNVGSYEQGINYAPGAGWTTISGWSDSLIKYISASESKLSK